VLLLYCCRGLTIGSEDSILVIKPEWLEPILNGDKTAEIRSSACKSKVGKRIWLCASRSGLVTGKARVTGCEKLTESAWKSMYPRHLVRHHRPYGGRTHAWLLADVERVAGIRIVRKEGAVIWQIGPG
tara:strand:- start:337 stop:720 length:384 start_codon:yes stop_codon:yes gene_type:complete